MTTPDRFGDRPGTALVTGGTGGIGSAIVRQLAREGAAVTFTYRSGAERAISLVEELSDEGWRVDAVQLDLTAAEDCAAVIAVVASHRGGLHTLVHAAGPHIPQHHLSTIPPATYATQLHDEAAAFFNIVAPAIPALRTTSGSIVAVTTAATSRYPVRDGLSASAKGAIEQLVRGLAAEEGRYGVRANCVGPGMLVDGMAARLMASGDLDDEALAVTRRNIALRRFGTAADIAAAVCFLASNEANFISGQTLNVDGGYSI